MRQCPARACGGHTNEHTTRKNCFDVLANQSWACHAPAKNATAHPQTREGFALLSLTDNLTHLFNHEVSLSGEAVPGG